MRHPSPGTKKPVAPFELWMLALLAETDSNTAVLKTLQTEGFIKALCLQGWLINGFLPVTKDRSIIEAYYSN